VLPMSSPGVLDWRPGASHHLLIPQATTGPHCSRGVQPGGICVRVAQREPNPGGPCRACARAASASGAASFN
jgi:hypothetical protein